MAELIIRYILEKCMVDGDEWCYVPSQVMNNGKWYWPPGRVCPETGRFKYLRHWETKAFYMIDEAMLPIHRHLNDHMIITQTALGLLRSTMDFNSIKEIARIIFFDYIDTDYEGTENKLIGCGVLDDQLPQWLWINPTYYAAVA